MQKFINYTDKNYQRFLSVLLMLLFSFVVIQYFLSYSFMLIHIFQLKFYQQGNFLIKCLFYNLIIFTNLMDLSIELFRIK
jgi:hypothetical protein